MTKADTKFLASFAAAIRAAFKKPTRPGWRTKVASKQKPQRPR